MDLLGPSIAEQQKDGAGVMVKTVIRIVDQAVHRIRFPASYSVLNVACSSLGIVHRDIKPENLLCALDDLSTIKIIDFSLFSHCQPSKYNPLKDRRHIVGSLYWASLNSHSGIGWCTPRSLAVALSSVLISIQCP